MTEGVGGSPAVVFPPPLTPELLVGLETLIGAVILWAAAPLIVRRLPVWERIGRVVVPAAAIVGCVLIAAAILAEQTPASDLANPVPRTVTSIAAGERLYQQNCAACHGVDARGEGPLASTTGVRPPSLVSGHLNSHSDGDIYYWISNGLPGGMPAWTDRLSETDRWHLTNYLRSMQPPR